MPVPAPVTSATRPCELMRSPRRGSGLRLPVGSHREAGDDVGRELDGLHRLPGPFADAGHGRGAGGDLRLAPRDDERVMQGPPRDSRHPDPHLELVLEMKEGVEIAGYGQAREARLLAGPGDGQAGLAPQRVLRLLHVPEEAAEVDDAGQVGLVEVHPATQPVLADHEAVKRWLRRSAPARAGPRTPQAR